MNLIENKWQDDSAARVSRVIFEYASRIGSSQDIDSLLGLNANLARDLVGADRCSIWLHDPQSDEMWTRFAHNVDTLRLPAGKGIVGACFRSGEPIISNDVHSDPRFLRTLDRETSYTTRNAVAMPLTNPKGNTIGVLQVLNREGGFSEADINLLRLAAAYAASALEQQQLRHDAETAKLLMRELEIAKEVQQRLFPQNLPKIEGMGYSAFCRPAQAVGGDYYDFIQLTPSHLAVTLGDVSGKGIPAAVFMASIQSSLRSHLIKAPNSLGRLMEDFNKVVCDTSTPSRYSTLVCCIVDISSRRLTYVNAGHVPPFLMRRSGTIERLRVGGPPVGLFAAASYEEESVRLEDGDLLFCCSDGFTEASNSNGEMWEEASVEGILQNQIGLAPPEVISNFVHTADQYAAGEDQADDMTLVVLQF